MASKNRILLGIIFIALIFMQGCLPIPPIPISPRAKYIEMHYKAEVMGFNGRSIKLEDIQAIERLLLEEGFVFDGTGMSLAESPYVGRVIVNYQKDRGQGTDHYSASISYSKDSRDYIKKRFILWMTFCDLLKDGVADESKYEAPNAIKEQAKIILSKSLLERTILFGGFKREKTPYCY